MATWKQLKDMDTRWKFIVFGYIRQKENELSLYNVPSMISYLCLKFYFHGEYFTKCTGNLKISNDKMSVNAFKNLVGYLDQVVYGNLWIDSLSNCIARWTFKINKNNIRIIVSSTEELGSSQKDRSPYYFFGKGLSGSYQDQPSPGFSQSTASAFTIRDVMTLTLNTKEASISLQKKDKSALIMFKNIKTGQDIKYKLATSLVKEGDSITLIDFDLTVLL